MLAVGADTLLYRLHPAQRRFVASRSKFKTAHPGRRAGKTRAAAVGLLRAALARPGALCLYLAITRRNARRLVWSQLRALDAQHRLGFSFSESELAAKAPNGSEIILAGTDDIAELEKYRGNAYDLVIVDEAGSFAPGLLQYFVEEILEAALADHDGALWLLGTPNRSGAGYFADACNGVVPGWEVHHWTLLDNWYMPHARAWLDSLLGRRRWTWDSPVVRREYLGQWVRDSELAVYAFDRSRNCGPFPALRDAHYLLGLDIGTADDAPTTAFSLWAYSLSDDRVWCVRSFKRAGLSPSDCAAKILAINAQYPLDRVVADAGGLGGGYIKEFRARYLPVMAAQKTDKRAFIELMNDDFRRGLVQIVEHENSAYIYELSNLQWRASKTERQEEDTERCPNHLSDSGLYAWRECRHYRASVDEPEKPLTADELAERERMRMRDVMLREQQRRLRAS